MKILDALRQVKIREVKAWKAIDWALSASNVDASVKIKAAEFILKRIYPEKIGIAGSGENGEIVIKVEKAEMQIGNNVQAPRFAIPNLS